MVQGDFSHCIVAIGIVPNTENIGLESLGIKTTKGHIDTDPMCRTNVPGIWAIGDVTAHDLDVPLPIRRYSFTGQHESAHGRAGGTQLPHEFATEKTVGAGDENRLVFQRGFQ